MLTWNPAQKQKIWYQQQMERQPMREDDIHSAEFSGGKLAGRSRSADETTTDRIDRINRTTYQAALRRKFAESGEVSTERLA
jgi:hypothetical protein